VLVTRAPRHKRHNGGFTILAGGSGGASFDLHTDERYIIRSKLLLLFQDVDCRGVPGSGGSWLEKVSIDCVTAVMHHQLTAYQIWNNLLQARCAATLLPSLHYTVSPGDT
jgi:hypothetical protein